MTTGYDQLSPCTWTGLDASEVDKYTKNKKSTDWEKPTLRGVRTKLRKQLLKLQRNACAYCRRFISVELGHHEVDHILAKGIPNYARFTYERINLVATCKQCNRNKGDHDVLITALGHTASYPHEINAYLWVHPYLHKYYDHIQIHEGMLFEAIGSTQHKKRGMAVIETCELDTLAAVEHRRTGEIANYAANTIDAITDTISAHRQLDDRVLVTLLRKNRKELRRLKKNTVERIVTAFRQHNFEGFARELKAAGLQ